MRISDAPAAGAPMLVADDDHVVRTLFATLFRATTGIASVIEAEDGAVAVELAREQRLDIAVLDLNMPRLDGVEAALQLRTLQPSLRIALHSSDPDLLRQRAAGLELPLFDKVDFESLLAWVEQQAKEACGADGHARVSQMAPKLDLCCSLCGYGIVSGLPPARCPMCGTDAAWVEPRGWKSHQAALHQRRAAS